MPPLISTTPTPSTTAPAERLRILLTQSDHPSGIYYAKEEARFTLTVENPAQDSVPLHGEVVFGVLTDDSKTFKPLSTTPIEPTEIKPQQRVRLTVGGTFSSPGPYQLRWNDQPIPTEPGFTLQCIYPPRATLAGLATMPATPGPWVARLPLASRTPNFLADFITRTGIARFVLEDPWPTDPPRPNDDLTALADSLTKTPAEFILRIQCTGPAQRDARQLTQLHDHVATLLKSFGSSITAIVVEPSVEMATLADQQAAYPSYYLAVYDAAKKHDKNVRMLGSGSTLLTATLLPANPKSNLLQYVDAIATTQAPGEMARLHAAAGRGERGERGGRIENRPIWVLPQHAGNMQTPDIAALALAEGAALVPVPDDDQGVTGNLLGSSVFFQRVSPDLPPAILVFQGNGYSVAALCSPAAAGLPDNNGPAPEKPATTNASNKSGTLEVADVNREFHIVDESGHNVDCRFGDLLRIPLDPHVRYLISPDAADDLVAILKQATLRNTP